MDIQIIDQAKLHFITERDARHARLSEGMPPAPAPPDFRARWVILSPALREIYLDRARFFATLKTDVRDAKHLEEVLVMLYTDIFSSTSREYAVTIDFMPLTEFQDFVKSRTQKLSDVGQSSSLPVTDEDHLGDDTDDSDDTVENKHIAYEFSSEGDVAILRLEERVAKGVAALHQLRQLLGEMDFKDEDSDWNVEVDQALEYSQIEKVIIGVVGTTGAGKSSLINAIIDEEKVLATNCMRAATAVATEISYNDGPSKYKAVVECIRREEWEQELQVLFNELIDSKDDFVQGRAPEDPQAASAFGKIRAVYPWLEPQNILKHSIESLLNHPSVSKLFGTSITIQETSRKRFTSKLRGYIDSSGKRGRKKKNATSESNINMKIWPLIRVVRLFVKSKALSTGAILVDLPGVSDSNAGRVAVADQYMRLCSAHWIVAPINRAVDDKIAQDLLDKNFKLQMQMDGAFGNLTFICSKTDDISVREVEDTLELQGPTMQMQKQFDAQKEQLEAKIKDMQAEKRNIRDELNNITEELEDFMFSPESGTNSVDASPLKRNRDSKCLEISEKPTSNLESQTADTSGDFPSTERYNTLKQQGSQLRHQRLQLDNNVRQLEKELEQLEEAHERMKLDWLRECIAKRNVFSKDKVRQGFAMGLRDMDLEDQEESAHEGAEPQPSRDYAKLGSELPVFTISSRAYQKLRGRLRKETDIVGFNHLQDTEIPQLQQHCLALTKKARESSATRFLVKTKLLLQSLLLWSSTSNHAPILTDAHKEMEANFQVSVAGLRKEMDKLIKEHIAALKSNVRENIFPKLARGASSAVAEMPNTIAHWNLGRTEGGLAFPTYRALCRRKGAFRDLDMNKEMVNPMLRKVANSWKETFDTHIPSHTKALAQRLQATFHKFHAESLNLADGHIPDHRRKLVDSALRTSCQTLARQLHVEEQIIKMNQKAVNRIHVGSISQELNATYSACFEIRGPGSLKRLRAIMEEVADQESRNIFRECIRSVQKGLQKLLEEIEERLTAKITSAVDAFLRNYQNVLITSQIKRLTGEQLRLKNMIVEHIRAVEVDLQMGLFVGEEAALEAEAMAGVTYDGGMEAEEDIRLKVEER